MNGDSDGRRMPLQFSGSDLPFCAGWLASLIVAEKLRLSLSDSDDEVKAAATVTVTGLTRMMAAGGAPAAGRGRVIVSSQRPIT